MRALAMILAFIAMLMAWGALWELDMGGGGVPVYPIVAMLTFLAIVVHEAGHAVAAWWTGGRVHAVVALPLELRFSPLRMKFARYPDNREIGGYVHYTPGPLRTRRDDILVAAAGPLANLVFALLVLAIAYLQATQVPFTTDPSTTVGSMGQLPSDNIVRNHLDHLASRARQESLTLIAHALAILSAGMGTANLLPFRGSDGAAIVEALRARPVPEANP